MLFSSLKFLLSFDPADNLTLIKGQSAAGLEPEVREPSWNEGLSYGPRRAADQPGDFGDVEGNAQGAEVGLQGLFSRPRSERYGARLRGAESCRG